jgi:NADPH:quinone reductase-like Zn-dependent oxidoreductase
MTSIPAFIPNPAAPGAVELGEVPRPVPRDDQALVAVEAYSINRGETFLLEKPRPGWRPGQDVAGRVAEAAADGSGPSVGARVVGHAWDGGWASLVPVATDALVELPDEVSPVTAATLPLAGLTVLRLLRASGSVAGRRVLVTGASGGVGHLLVELAAAQGAQITAVSSRGERLAALGAHVVSSVENASGPFDVAFESVGGRSLEAVLERMTEHGTVIWFGGVSGEPASVDFFSLPAGVTIRHFVYWREGVSDGDDLSALVRLAASGRIHPEVGLVADWHETPDALIALRERRVRGNAVLTIERNDSV